MPEKLSQYIQSEPTAKARIIEAMDPEEKLITEAEGLAELFYKRRTFNNRILTPATITIIGGMFAEIFLTPNGLTPEQYYIGCLLPVTLSVTMLYNLTSRGQAILLKSKLDQKLSELKIETLKQIAFSKPKREYELGDDGELFEIPSNDNHSRLLNLNHHR